MTKTITESNAVKILESLRDGFTEAGLVVSGKVRGYLPSNHRGSVDWAIGPTDDKAISAEHNGTIFVNLVIDGKANGLRFDHWDEIDSCDDEITLHSPTNAATLYPKIKKVFEAEGFEVAEVRESGYQMMWDYDVEYSLILK